MTQSEDILSDFCHVTAPEDATVIRIYGGLNDSQVIAEYKKERGQWVKLLRKELKR